MAEQLSLPGAGSYCCKIVLGSIPKLVVMTLAIIIVAYHTELYFAPLVDEAADDQPVAVCGYNDLDDDFYGYRICINSIAGGIINVFLCVTLLIVDLLVPCVTPSYVRLSQLFSLIWSIIMALYYLITSSLIANLYNRYCDNLDDIGSECDDDDEKFTIFPVFGFFIMVAWVVMAVIALIRLIIGR